MEKKQIVEIKLDMNPAELLALTDMMLDAAKREGEEAPYFCRYLSNIRNILEAMTIAKKNHLKIN